MMLKLKLQYFGHLMRRVDSLEKTLMLGGIGGRRVGDDRGWDGWMASLTQWTWVRVNSGSWWGTGRPGVLWFMGSQRVGHNWATDLIWSDLITLRKIRTSTSLQFIKKHILNGKKLMHIYLPTSVSQLIHFLLIYHMHKVKVKSLNRVWIFVTLWTIAYQIPSPMGFSRQEYWIGLPFPPPGDLPNPGIKSGFPALQSDALLSEPPGKPHSQASHIHMLLWNHGLSRTEFASMNCESFFLSLLI